jgi:hypothetical protein
MSGIPRVPEGKQPADEPERLETSEESGEQLVPPLPEESAPPAESSQPVAAGEGDTPPDAAKRRSLSLIFRAIPSSLLLHSAAANAIGGALVIAGKDLYDSYSKNISLREEAKGLGINLLFGASESKSGVPSVDNPFSGEFGVTKPTRDAIANVLASLELDPSVIREQADLRTEQLVGSFVFFGGPVANKYSRHIMGLEGPSPLLEIAHHGRRAILPIHFDIVRPQGSKSSVPYSSGKAGGRPAWEIVVHEKRGERRARVDVADGRQANDFLVITSIPNVYSPSGVLGRNRITTIAGVHGPGTRAVALILKDPSLLNELHKLVRGYEAWQALLEIRGIDHETQWPKSVRIERCVPIDADFGKLATLLAGKPFLTDPRAPNPKKLRL